MTNEEIDRHVGGRSKWQPPPVRKLGLSISAAELLDAGRLGTPYLTAIRSELSLTAAAAAAAQQLPQQLPKLRTAASQGQLAAVGSPRGRLPGLVQVERRLDMPREFGDRRTVADVAGTAQAASSLQGGGDGLKTAASRLLQESTRWQAAAAATHIEKMVRKPKLQDQAPSGWRIPPRVDTACTAFDLRYLTRCARLESAYYANNGSPERGGDRRHRTESFEAALDEVLRTRFVPPTRAAEVREVGQVIYQNHELVCSIFSYYSCINPSRTVVSPNEWKKFVDDFGLAVGKSKHCKRSDLDRIFLAVDVSAKKSVQASGTTAAGAAAVRDHESSSAAVEPVEARKGALGRPEFQVALVRIAIARYVLPGDIPDVSDAVRRLLEVHIPSRAATGVFAPPDFWRRKYFYSNPVARVYAQHEPTLRLIFGAIAVERGPKGLGTEHRLLLSINDWRAFLRSVNLIDRDVSEREASLCWAWSRTYVVDVSSSWGRRQYSHLPFLGFCEALGRLAALKALPTPAEIAASDFETAHEYLEYMERSKKPKYHEYLARHASPWGAEPSRQPLEASLRGLISIIVGRMESDADGEITDESALQAWSERFGLGPVHGRDRY